MIDIEGLSTNPNAVILTIAAQAFDPFNAVDYDNKYFYARVTLESQEDRDIQQCTVDWWATQPDIVKNEAFAPDDRIPLGVALDELAKLIWHSKRIWAQGPTYDMTILENAYKSLGKHLPWKYHAVRDSRTVFGLWPDMPKPPTSHHALEDCRRQIMLLRKTLKHLNITALV